MAFRAESLTFCSSALVAGVSSLQDPEGSAQRGSGCFPNSAAVPGRLLPSTRRHEQGHWRVPVQSAAVPAIYGHCGLQGEKQVNTHANGKIYPSVCLVSKAKRKKKKS